MKPAFRLLSVVLITALITACASAPHHDPAVQGASANQAALGARAPSAPGSGDGTGAAMDTSQSVIFEANGPYPVDLVSIPTRVYDPNNQLDRKGTTGRIESPIPDELVDLLREEAMLLPPSLAIQKALTVGVDQLGPEQLGPSAGVSFDSLDFTDCCGGGGNVPPDSELAVGPDHIIAVVNVAFEIYDKSGNSLYGPVTFSSFFSGTPGCSNTGVFDPNVLYDEAADRFILAIDGDGTDYCVAATQTSDPLGSWNRYGFPTASGAEFFDYPHAGVGVEAIYMGANMFTSGYSGSRVWAMEKADMYNGTALTVVERSTGFESTPQPMNLHGFAQGSWPASGPHYILTDDQFNGDTYGVWSWEDPFGIDVFTDLGTVNVEVASGVTSGMPISVPQQGSSTNLEGNDFRVQDAEYRNGYIWMSNTVSCNPGLGTVDCIRWAKIDPAGPSILDAGVYASNGEFRTFADLAVNDCDDMAIGYTKSSDSMYPAVFVTGRESGDAAGTLQAEVQLKAGERSYFSFDTAPLRWGDYSGMTIDPDGQTFWYLGEYSKNLSGVSANWGNYIGSFTFPACSPTPQPPGKASSPDPVNDALSVPLNTGLSWTAGSGATSHDVYFNGAFIGNQSATTYTPGGLTANTAYTWRIDERNSEGSTTGDTWTFTTEAPPGPASSPSPANNANDVALTAVLSWTAGAGATSHIVHFDGTTYPARSESIFDPGPLSPETTYNWSVDEVNSAGTTSGADWSFETAAVSAFRVTSVNVESVRRNGNKYRGEATVTVLDNSGVPAPVSGVFVSGTFSGDWNGERSGTTGTNGTVLLTTPSLKNARTFDFCVDNASKSGWEFDQANSVGLCNGPPPPPPTTGMIAGTVTDAATLLVIQGASVSADTGESDTTNANGDYTLSGVPTGSRNVSVSASGYNTKSASITVSDGATSTVDFALDAVIPGTGSVQVRSITVSTVNQGKGRKKGRAVVVVEDDSGNIVTDSQAAVSGYFSGTFSDSVGPTNTNGSGSVTFETGGTAKGGVSVTFCVTGITHPALEDFAGLECQSL